MSILFSLGGLLAHLQNPLSWRTSLSLLVWLLSYGLSGLGGPYQEHKVLAGIAHKVIEARKPPHRDKVETFPAVLLNVQGAAERTPLFGKLIISKPKKIRQMFFYFWKVHRMPFYINVF